MDILYKYTKYLSNYAETTKENYLTSLKIFMRFLGEQYSKLDIIRICNIKKKDIYNYIAWLDGKSKGTIKNRIYGIKKFYNFVNPSIAQELFEDIRYFETSRKLPKVLNIEQVKDIINYYQDKRNRLIVYLFLQTGIRLKELANIKIEDINLIDQTIRIMTKGSKERIVFISARTKQEIEDYISNKDASNFLFNIKRREIQHIVTKAMKNLNIEGSTHTLRHTIATLMYEQTQDILLVKEFLGHKSIESTQIYTHISNKLVKEAVEKNPLANM